MFYKATELYSPGEIIRKGHFGRLIEGMGLKGRPHLVYREFVFELIRKTHYQNLPSRMRSTFVFPTEEIARKAKDRAPYGEHIYRIRAAQNPCPKSSFDMAWIDAFEDHFGGGLHAFQGIEEFVNKYWTGEKYFDQEKSVNETLIDSDIIIVERITPVAENGLKK